MDAVGQRLAVGHGRDLAGLAGLIHGRHRGSLHTDDLAGRLQALDGQRDAADQAAAADGADHLVHFGQLLEDLQADGALAGHDVGIIEGMGEGVAVLLGQAVRLTGGIVVNAGDQHHFRAVILGGFHLADGSTGGHADDGLDAQLGGGKGNALSMVAGGAGDHAAVRFFLGQGADLVVSAAQLERAGQLQVLRLNIDVLADLRGRIQGRLSRDPLQRLLCVLDHFQCQHLNFSFSRQFLHMNVLSIGVFC